MSTSLEWKAPAAGIRLFLSKATGHLCDNRSVKQK